ncbi:MAG: LacI family DNA-binding transcriptional regulator [Angelakisella sp.]
MVTQKEIARQAGISVSTVSRILRGEWEKYASADLRDAVWKTAKELGYQPNATARSLRLHGGGQQERQLRLMTLLARPAAGEGDEFFGELVRGVDEELLRQGLPVLPTGTVRQQLLQNAGSKVDGVLLLGRCSPEAMRQLRTRLGAVPMIGVGLNPAGHGEQDQVFCNGRNLAETAVQYLLTQGHTSIAYIGECSAESRYAGYYDTLTANGIPCKRDVVVEAVQTEAGGAAAANLLLVRNTDATAIFCANDNVAVGVIRTLTKAGISIPLQMGIISIDDIQSAQRCTPRLTTIHIPKEEMGRMAVKLLLDRLSGGHNEPLRLELPTRLVRRESC